MASTTAQLESPPQRDSPPIPEQRIQLVPFQSGADGFVRFGTHDGNGPGGWVDYCYMLAHGGRGAGKSKGGALRAVYYATRWPRSLGVVTAPTFPMMRTATLPALIWALERFGLTQKDYKYNADREEIRLVNGSTIVLLTTEHPERLRGMDAAWFWMDEPRNSPRVAFLNLQAALRQQGYPHQGWLTTTPAGKRHWLFEIFFTERPGIAVFRTFPAKTRDNPFGGELHYQQSLSTYGNENSLLVRQEFGGEFVVMEGLVYGEFWDHDYHVKPMTDWPMSNFRVVLGGVDFGFINPSAILVEGYDRDGRRGILDEWYQTQATEDEIGDAAGKLCTKWGIQYMPCDSADPRNIFGLRRRGLPAIPAFKRVGTLRDPSHGIGLCARILRQRGPNEEQLFFVNPECEHFIEEIETYAFEEPKEELDWKEKPKSYFNHLMDAWRYSEEFIAQKHDRPERVKVGGESGLKEVRARIKTVIKSGIKDRDNPKWGTHIA